MAEFDTPTMMFQGLGWTSCSNQENIKKSVYVLKMKNNIGLTSKGIGCAIKAHLPHNESVAYFLLTSSKAISHADFANGQTLTADRYCSNYPKHKENHRIEISKLPNGKEIDEFTFLRLDNCKTPEHFLVYDQSKFDSTITAHGESLFAYTFVNKTFVEVKFEYNNERSVYERTEIVPPTAEDELSMEKLIGAPVIADDSSESPLVVGVLGCFESQIIRPILFGKHDPFEQRKSKQPQHNETTDSGDKYDTPVNTPSESSSQESVSERDKVDTGFPSPSEDNISRQAGTNVGQDAMTAYEAGSKVDQFAMRSHESRQAGSNVGQKEVNSVAKCLDDIKIKETKPVQEEAEAVPCLFEKAGMSLQDQKITILDEDLWEEMRIKLDPIRNMGGDFRTLAGKLGYKMDMVWFFRSQESPTCCLLKHWCPQKGKGTIKQLCSALRESKREDVMELIKEWISKKGCKCEKCAYLK